MILVWELLAWPHVIKAWPQPRCLPQQCPPPRRGAKAASPAPPTLSVPALLGPGKQGPHSPLDSSSDFSEGSLWEPHPCLSHIPPGTEGATLSGTEGATLCGRPRASSPDREGSGQILGSQLRYPRANGGGFLLIPRRRAWAQWRHF